MVSNYFQKNKTFKITFNTTMNYTKILLTCFLVSMSIYTRAEVPLPISVSLWDEVRALKGVPSQIGLKNAELYVFFDPNCYICAELFDLSKIQNQSEKALSTKSFAFDYSKVMPAAIWIPVYQMKSSSRDMSAALLRSQSFKDIQKNYEEFDFSNLQGFTKEIVPTDREIAALEQSKLIWKRLGGGTPLFVFKDSKGSYKRFIGIPPHPQLKNIFASVNSNLN
jgi:hypothetical protein